MKILIVEDEPKVQKFISQALTQAGMVTDAIWNLEDLGTVLKTNVYDCVVLDRLLNGKDGIHLLSAIRKKMPRTKILILSALGDAEEKVRGLTAGADDYLGKPFHVDELIARVRSLIRRGEKDPPTGGEILVRHKNLKIDLISQKVYLDEKRVELTGKEFRTLSLLARHPGRVFSKASILDQVWDMNHYPESNVVEVTIANLRSKLQTDLVSLIHSRRGVGYWFGDP